MRNRIIAFTLLLTMIFSVNISAGAKANADTTEYTDSEALFMGLGIIDIESYNPSSKLTRGEFATLISKILLFSENEVSDVWHDTVFGNDNADKTVESVLPLFNDVDISHSEYGGIYEVVSRGYMNGIGKDSFAPDSGITVAEAVKVVVSMLGHDGIASALGGYPNGYIKAANKCKLLSGVVASGTDVITTGDAISIIANAFDVYVKDIVAISDGKKEYQDSDETFMNFFLKLASVQGTMTDNGFTSLTSKDSKYGNGTMIIDGKKLKYNHGARAYSDYIGREVTAYYSIDTATEDVCVFIEPDDDAEVITEGTSFKSGVLYYTINGRDYSTKLPRSSKVIYNGVNTEERYSDDMLCVDNGTVTLTKNSGGNYTVVVKKYKDMIVSNISYDSHKVYSEIKFPSLKAGRSVICLEEENEFENVLLLDSYGREITIDSIVKGDVLSVAESTDGKKYAEVVKCSVAPYELELDSYTDKEFITADNAYEFGEAYLNASNKVVLEAGRTYKVYVNNSNRIVWVSEGTVGTSKIGIFTGISPVGTGGFTEKFAIRLYTQDAKIEIMNLPDRLTVNRERVDASDVEALLAAHMGKAVLYDAKDGVITNLVTPAAYGEEGVKDWYHVSPSFKMFDGNEGVEPFEMDYQEPTTGGAFGWSLIAYNKSATNTRFTVPTSVDDFDNEKRFFVNRTLTPKAGLTVEAYSTIKNDPVPNVFVFYENADGGAETIKDGDEALLITRKVSTVNQDGDPVNALKGYHISYNKLTEVTIPLSENAYMSKRNPNEVKELIPIKPEDSEAECGPLYVSDLEPGDIVRYAKNGNGEITIMRIAFDYSQMKGFMEQNKSYAWSGWTSFAGPVLNVTDKGLKIVTNILPEEIDYTNVNHLKNIRSYAFSSSYPLVFVEKTERGLTFRSGTYADITSYEVTGDSGVTDFACMLAHYTGGRMGGVIYVK